MNKDIFKYGPPVNMLTIQRSSRNSTFTTNIDNSIKNLIQTNISTTINNSVIDVITNNLSTVINNSSTFINDIQNIINNSTTIINELTGWTLDNNILNTSYEVNIYNNFTVRANTAGIKLISTGPILVNSIDSINIGSTTDNNVINIGNVISNRIINVNNNTKFSKINIFSPNTTFDSFTDVNYSIVTDKRILLQNQLTIGDANFNIGMGIDVLSNNTTGEYNIAIGTECLYSSTDGSVNIASGYQSLYFNTIGSYNIANGYQSLYSNTTGNENIATGYKCLYTNTTGSSNIASGSQSLYSNTTGSSNIASGFDSLHLNTEGNNNIAHGVYSLYSNITGSNNIGIGYNCGLNSSNNLDNTIGFGQTVKLTASNSGMCKFNTNENTTFPATNQFWFGEVNDWINILCNRVITKEDTDNIELVVSPWIIDDNYDITTYSNLTCGILTCSSIQFSNETNTNTIYGYNSLFSNTTGINNSAYGYNSLFSNTTGINNSAYGYNSLYSNITGSNNIGIGYNCGLNSSNNLDNTIGFGQTVKLTASNSGMCKFNTNENTTFPATNQFWFGQVNDWINILCNRVITKEDTDNIELVVSPWIIDDNYDITTYSNLTCGILTCSSIQFSNETNTNTIYGYNSLFSNTTGINNSAYGYNSLFSNTTGINNSAYGYNSLYSNIIGSNNIGIGYNCGLNSSDNLDNTIGFGQTVKLTASNSGMCKFNTNENTTFPATNQFWFGQVNDWINILCNRVITKEDTDNIELVVSPWIIDDNYDITTYSNLTCGILTCSSIQFSNGTNTNTNYGYNSLFSNTTGINNSAYGYNSLFSNTIGSNNIGIGYNCGLNSSDNLDNTIGFGQTVKLTASNSGMCKFNTSENTTFPATNQFWFGQVNDWINILCNRVITKEDTDNIELVVSPWIIDDNYDITTYSNLTCEGSCKLSTSGNHNVIFGYQSLYSNTTGYNNIAHGFQSLYSNTIGNNNIANGYQSLYRNTSSGNNIANGYRSLYYNTSGINNIATGFQSLFSNTTGRHNIANGESSLYSNTTGNYNTAYGYRCLYSNTTGNNNIANGSQSLYYNTAGNDNIATGYRSLYLNTTGTYNIASGYQSLYTNTTGSNNIASGGNSLYSNTTGSSNIAVGNSSLYSNTIGYYNIAHGDQSLYSNTTGSTNIAVGNSSLYFNTTGYNNIANGFQSLYSNTTGTNNIANGGQSLYLNTTGTYNIANGGQSLYSNTTGSVNIANGIRSLYSNTTGYYNIANGSQSLYSNTTGENNIAHGFQSLYSNTTGYYNIANGGQSLYSNTTGENNIAHGFQSLYSNTAGNNNIAYGENSLYSNTTGSQNIGIGYNCGLNSSNNLDNTIGLGQTVKLTASNSGMIKFNTSENTTFPATNQFWFGQVNDWINILCNRVITKEDTDNIELVVSPWIIDDNYDITTYSNLTCGILTCSSIQFSNGTNTNTNYGYNSLFSNTIGIYNSAYGYQSLYTNTGGNLNSAYGQNTLYLNTTGYNNTAIGTNCLLSNTTGNFNTTSGANGLLSNTTGSNNSAIGATSLYSNTTGINNTACGYYSLYSNITGSNNIGIGYNCGLNSSDNLDNTIGLGQTVRLTASNSGMCKFNTSENTTFPATNQFWFGQVNDWINILCNRVITKEDTDNIELIVSPWIIDDNYNITTYSNLTCEGGCKLSTSGNHNVIFGYQSLYSNTIGQYNISIGAASLYSNTIGDSNIANGYESLYSNTTGYNNIAHGFQSLYSNTIGNNNIANGYQSLYSNTSSGNIANGYRSLYYNTSGINNIAHGVHSLFSNTTGGYNIANGVASLYSNTTGGYNIANGAASLYSNTTGNYNTAYGYRCLYSNTTGNNNIANGYRSLYLNTTGTYNIASGYQSLYTNTTGSNNIANGYQSLYSNTTGSRNIGIGYNCGLNSSNNLDNTIALGQTVKLTASNSGMIKFNTSENTTFPATNQFWFGQVNDWINILCNRVITKEDTDNIELVVSPWIIDDNYDITTNSAVSIGTTTISNNTISTSNFLYGSVNGLANGLYPVIQYYRLDSIMSGNTGSSAQNIIGKGVNLVANTIYEFEGNFALSLTATPSVPITGTFIFGGFSTINNINHMLNLNMSNDSFVSGLVQTNLYITSSSQVISGNLLRYIVITVKGTVSINTAGTFIPQYSLLAATIPYFTQIGSYFKIYPIGVSGQDTSIGTWSSE